MNSLKEIYSICDVTHKVETFEEVALKELLVVQRSSLRRLSHSLQTLNSLSRSTDNMAQEDVSAKIVSMQNSQTTLEAHLQRLAVNRRKQRKFSDLASGFQAVIFEYLKAWAAIYENPDDRRRKIEDEVTAKIAILEEEQRKRSLSFQKNPQQAERIRRERENFLGRQFNQDETTRAMLRRKGRVPAPISSPDSDPRVVRETPIQMKVNAQKRSNGGVIRIESGSGR